MDKARKVLTFMGLMNGFVHQILHHSGLVAAGKLRAAETILPRLQRKLATLHLLETELLEEASDVGEGKNRMQTAVGGLAFQLFDDCPADAAALRIGIDRKRT